MAAKQLGSVLGELKTLSFRHYLVAFALVFAFALPGFLLIFVFKRELFLSIDVFKLALLALSIASPVFALNYIAAFLVLPHGQQGITSAGELVFSGMQTIVVFNGSLLISFYLHLPIRTFLGVLLVGEAIVLIIDLAILGLSHASKPPPS